MHRAAPVQGRYREGTGNVQGRYREGTGKVQGRQRSRMHRAAPERRGGRRLSGKGAAPGKAAGPGAASARHRVVVGGGEEEHHPQHRRDRSVRVELGVECLPQGKAVSGHSAPLRAQAHPTHGVTAGVPSSPSAPRVQMCPRGLADGRRRPARAPRRARMWRRARAPRAGRGRRAAGCAGLRAARGGRRRRRSGRRPADAPWCAPGAP